MSNTWAGWQQGILNALHAPVTPQNLAFLDAWQRAESGGGGGAFNPFNTTRVAKGLEGATNYNSGGVKNYLNPQMGIRATAGALLDPSLPYSKIVAALRSGKATPQQLAGLVVASPWGTKHFPTLSGVQSASVAPTAPSVTPTPAGLDPSALAMSNLGQIASTGHFDAMGGLAALAQMRQNAQTPLNLHIDHTGPLSPNAGPIVKLAEQYLGTPYKWGGAQPGGFDCSGFAQYVFGKLGISLPHSTYAQAKMGRQIGLNQLQPGDLVFFSQTSQGPGHEGLYIGHGQFIHAPHTGDVVKISSINSSWYRQHFVTARRVA